MILYFSATGNSKYVAQRIAKALGTECVSIEKVTERELTNVHGFVSPVYAWGIPSVVEDFLVSHRLQKGGGPLFFVVTYGTTHGQSCYWANQALKTGSGMTFDAYYSVRMPDTWTPIFNLSDAEKVAATNEKAEPQLQQVIELISQGSTGDHASGRMPAIARIVHRPYYKTMRQTKHFSVEDGCVGCGLCAKKCPVQAIEIQDGRPVWVKDQCAACLRCLHTCPKFAIQHGKRTKAHGQYRNPHVRV